MTLNSWDSTTIESSIYSELNDFINSTRHADKSEVSGLLKEKTTQAFKLNDVNSALMWLNEYQLLNKNDTFADEYERIIAPLYDKMLAAAKRPCSFFQNAPHGSLNIELLKDRYIGERCFIIGNGPSLNKIDLKKLKNEFTFGVNSIFLAREQMGFETTFYCVEDTHVANDRKYEIQTVNSPLKFFGHYLKNTILPHPHNVYLNILLDYRRYAGFPYFSVDAFRRLWVGGSVSYVNMQLAYYMGFKNVYLIGFDHEYSIPSSAIVNGANIQSTTEDPNHFHPDYFGKGYNWHVPLVNRMELGYIKARRAFELDGREIVNLTPGGCLEVFRREKFEDVMAVDYSAGKCPADLQQCAKPCPMQLREKEVKISVIVPAYNVADCLVDTLVSINAQSFRDFEVIIVNDGSTDNTMEVAERCAAPFSNMRVISQENKGLGGARNTGIEHAHGKYCTFVDSDDLINPDMLKELFTAAEKKQADIVQCGYERVQNGKTLNNVAATFEATGFHALFQIATRHSFSAWAKLYRMDFLREHDLHFEDHVYHEDIEFSIKAHYFASTTKTIPYIGYVWIMRDGSITSRVGDKHIHDISKIIGKLKLFYINENVFDKLHQHYYALCYRLFALLLTRIYNIQDIWQRTLLLRTFRRELERHDLDYHGYAFEALPLCAQTAYILRNALFSELKISELKKPVPGGKKFRKIKKFVKNPYVFFKDVNGPLNKLRHLFFYCRH